MSSLHLQRAATLLPFAPLDHKSTHSRRGLRLSLAAHQVGVAADVLAALRWRIQAFRSSGGPRTIQETLNDILGAATGLVACDAAGVYVLDRRRRRIRNRVIRGYAGGAGQHATPEEADEPLRGALMFGKPTRVHSEALKVIAGRPEARARVVVPITGSRGLVLGAIDLISDHLRGFDDFTVDLLTVFAAAVASTIDSDRLHRDMAKKAELDRDLSLARELVEATASAAPPAIPGFDLHGVQQSSLAIGGDYWEVLPFGVNRWYVVVADVSGKGVSAALLVSATRALIRSAVETGASLLEIARFVNRFFRASGNGHYVTLFNGVLDPETRVLTYINAGHNPPVLSRADGTVGRLDQAGLPLGLFDRCDHRETRVALHPDDVLAVYTDGVVEPSNERDEQFGDERLVAALRRAAPAGCRDATGSVLTELRNFAGVTLHDDRTLVLLKTRQEVQ